MSASGRTRKSGSFGRRFRFLLAAASMSSAVALFGDALPQGANVTQGAAEIARTGSQMTISQTTSKLGVDWQSFSIGAGNSVRFVQPGSDSVAINRVIGNDQSQILGSLSSNGKVFLLNPNGVIFGAGARVDVGGLVASAARSATQDSAGRWVLSDKGDGAIINQGHIVARDGGFVVLDSAHTVRNSGLIEAANGGVALAAGQTTRLSLDRDGLFNAEVDGATIDALVANKGLIVAEGGSVFLTASGRDSMAASVVNQDGVIRVASVQRKGGRIVLSAGAGAVEIAKGELDADGIDGGSIEVTGATARLDGVSVHARGEASGGAIRVDSAGRTSVAGSSLDAQASGPRGLGGDIRVGGASVELTASTLTARAALGQGSIFVGGGYQGASVAGLTRALDVSVDRDTLLDVASTGAGAGGRVIVWSDAGTLFSGRIDGRAMDASFGGDGGFAEVSGKLRLAYEGSTNLLTANPRSRTGDLLLDPYDLTISTASSGVDSSTANTFAANADSSSLNATTLVAALATANVNVTTGTAGTQAGDITVSSAVVWDANTLLTLTAAGKVNVNAAISNANAGISSGVTLVSNGAGVLGGVGGAGNISARNITVTVNDAGATDSLSGVISTGNGLEKRGAGVLTLSGDNTYTGTTTIAGGSVIFDVADAKTVTLSGVISGSGNLVKSGAGTLVLAGANTYTGATTVNSGKLQVGNGGSVGAITGTSGITISSALISSFEISKSGSVTLSGVIGTTATISGDGNFTLSSTNGNISVDRPVTLTGFGSAIMLIAGRDLTLADSLAQGTISFSQTITTSAAGSIVIFASQGNTANINTWLMGADYGRFKYYGSLYSVANAAVSSGSRKLFYRIQPSMKVSGLVADDRPYDGDRYATIDWTSINTTFGNGFGDGIYLDTSESHAVFVKFDAGENIRVGFADVVLKSNDNYKVVEGVLHDPSSQLHPENVSMTATISKKVLEVAGTQVAQSKAYDGNTVATVISLGTVTGIVNQGEIDGERPGEITATGAYDSKDAGERTVEVNYVLKDSATFRASNYSLGPIKGLKSTITEKVLTITGASLDDKPYDGQANTLGALVYDPLEVLAGETVTASAAGTLRSKNVGTYNDVGVTYRLAGTDSRNYTLSVDSGILTQKVKEKVLTITGASLADKPYDGQANTLGALVYDPLEVVAGETVTASAAGTLRSKNVGTYNDVGVTYRLAGTDSRNYTLSVDSGILTQKVKEKVLTITGASISQKAYDGTTVAGTLNMGVLSGFVDTETVTATGRAGVLSSAGVGVNTVQVSYTLADGMNGGLASNYLLGTGTLSALIVSSVSPSIIDAGFLQADSLHVGRFSSNSAAEFSNSWKYGVPPSHYQDTKIQFSEDSYDRFLDKLRPNQR